MISIIRFLLVIIFTLEILAVGSEECVVSGQKICIDESQREVDGYKVKRCWKYREIFKCVGKEKNNCDVLEENRGCSEITGKCINYSINGICSHYEKQFNCGQNFNQNGELKLIDTEFKVIRDEKDLEKCTAMIKDNLCELVSEDCIEPSATKEINGKRVFKECWKWDRKYQCRTNSIVNECKALQNRGCKELSRQCIHYQGEVCEHYIVKYQCEDKILQKNICKKSKYCVGDNCQTQKRNSNHNFADSISKLSIFAQLPKDQQNCSCNPKIDGDCKAKAAENGSFNNCQLFNGSAKFCRKYTGEFNCCADKGFIRKILACKQEEKDLALKKEGKLCHFIGTWSGKGLNRFKKKSSYCCFNSQLARIVQEQGRMQLGKGWGSPQFPDCNGLSLAEINKIDFSQIDFGELYQNFIDKADRNFSAQKQTISKKIDNYRLDPQNLMAEMQGKVEQDKYDKR